MLQRSPGARSAALRCRNGEGGRGYGEIGAGRVEAGIADLSEAIAWFASSRLRYTRLRVTSYGSLRVIFAEAIGPSPDP